MRKRAAASGFTLVELMAVLAIMVLISLVILTSTNRFNSAILLRSLAYDVGLSIREAQLYGVAVKGASTPVNCPIAGIRDNFCASYGVHFTYPMPAPPAPSYFLFSDVNNDGVYDTGDQNNVDTFSAQYGFSVSNFCVSNGINIFCTAAGAPASTGSLTGTYSAGTVLTSLDIVFKRPNPDAIIYINGNPNASYSAALIVVSAPGGATRSVSVSLTGQIVIQ